VTTSDNRDGLGRDGFDRDEQIAIEPVGDDLPTEDVPAAPKPKRTARDNARTGVRAAVGLVGVAVGAAAILVATLVPLPSVGGGASVLTVTPVPTAQQLVCPGPLLRLGDESGQEATIATAVGSAVVRYESSSGSVTSAPISDPDAAAAGSATEPVQLSTPAGGAGGDDDLLVAGAQSQATDDEGFAGLAAVDCTGVATESWLVGGATTVGRTTLLSIANPSDTASTVSVEISAEGGEVSAPGATGIVVEPHGQRVLSLAGFAPDVESPVVHVVSRGGQIVASLQQSTVRGLESGGVDIVGAGQAPATELVIPGIAVTGADVLATRLGEEGYSDLGTVLRVFVPGDELVNAQVSVIADDGSTTGASFTRDLEPGVVEDMPLDGLVDGSYTVTIESSAPIVAGVRVSSVAASSTDANGATVPGESDFAWVPTTAELDDEALVTVAPGPAPRAHFYNPGTAEATVTLEATGVSDAVSVVVPAGASASVGVVAGESYRVGGFDLLYGAISLSDPARLAAYPVEPPVAGSTPIGIYPG
jgi:hypothetical protein